MCAVEAQNVPLRSIVPLANRSVNENILDVEVIADHIQRDAMRAVVHFAMIETVSYALLTV